jgi:D-alanine-D-alanine ligase
MRLRVALLFNLRSNAPPAPGAPADVWADLDSEHTVEALAEALLQGGHEVIPLEGDIELYGKLRELRPDIAFNICEGHQGDSREAQVPAILEMLGIPYTGSKILTLALTLDKPMCKRVLIAEGLPTPPFQVFACPDELLDPHLRFPLIVKPSSEGTGMGITCDSIVQDEYSLREQVARIVAAYRQPALVEEFVDGREVTVGILGNEELHVLPILEVDFSPCPAEEAGIYTSRVKTELYNVPRYLCPAPLEEAIAEDLRHLAVRAFHATGCLDVARVDFRLDRESRPWILEINPLPGLSPGISDLVMIAEADGISHTELVNAILDHAWRRYDHGRPRLPAVEREPSGFGENQVESIAAIQCSRQRDQGRG